jgi:hypothetical protein
MMEKTTIDDSLTAAMSVSDRSFDELPRTHRHSFFKRSKCRSSSIINIEDLPAEERIKAAKFDIDGNGTLDKIELAMMRYDKDGDGQLGLDEVHRIVEEHLHDRHNISAMKKVIVGLTCFVFVLSLSNLGTSIASALLVKDTTADYETAEMKIAGTSDVMGTQTSAETFTALEMDTDTRRARRAMVVESLKANPWGEHAHRRLGKGGDGCKGKKCDGNISFDTNYMSQDSAEKIKAKCDLGRVVNIRRSFPGGMVKNDNLCKTGASVVVKEKQVKRKKGNGKGKNRIGFDMVVTSDGKDTLFECDGKNCYMSGTNLLQTHGQPCNTVHGNDDCAAGLVCIKDVNDSSGKCLSNYDTATWYVAWDWNNSGKPQCVQDCNGNNPNCGGFAGNWDEMFSSHTLCCNTHLSYLTGVGRGDYSQCVPDYDFIKNGE